MGHPLPDREKLVELRDQPVEYLADIGGLYFRAILLKNAGATVPQHVHDYSHVTLVAAGAARLWVDGVWKGDFAAFQALDIEANKEHLFQSLEANTRLVCVHQVSAVEYRIAAKNRFGG